MTTTHTSTQAAGNALQVRPFRLLWANNLLFFLVANAQRFAFGWLVLDGLNRTESDQGIVVFTLGLPTAFLVLQAGVWADRWDRRRMLIATQVAGGAVMAGTAMLVGSGRIGMGWVVVATLVAGAASAIGQPVRQALIPALVDRSQLYSAIALNALAMTTSMILGPVFVKLAGDAFGFEGAFWFQAILMFSGIAFLLRLDVPAHEEVRKRRSIVSETAEAFRHVRDDRHLRTLFLLLLMASMTVNPAIMVTLQAHVKEELGRTAGEAAIPFAVMGLGIALSSLFVMRKGDMANKGAAFQRAMMVGATCTFVIGRLDSFGVTLLIAFCMGLAGGFYINMNQGLIQSSTPQPLMGRVMGLYTLISFGVMPFGALALGFVAEAIGTGNTISLAGLIGFAVVTTTYVSNAELRRLS